MKNQCSSDTSVVKKTCETLVTMTNAIDSCKFEKFVV